MKVNLISESVFFTKGHGVHTAFLNTAEMIKVMKEKVVINSFKKTDIAHIHTIGLFSLLMLLTTKPRIVTAHVTPDSFIGSLVGAKYWVGLSAKYLIFFYNTADMVFAVSPMVKEDLIKLGIKKPIEIVPNAINTHRFKPGMRSEGRKKFGFKDEEFIVLGVGQIQARKGVLDFIEVAKKMPHITFVWAGGTPFKSLTEQPDELKNALQKPPSNFRHIGILNYNEVPLLYNASDVHFFPSYQETAGITLMEAGACKIPILVRNLDVYKKLYETGYLDASSNDGFIKIIEKLYNSKSFREEYGKKGFELAQRFSLEKVGKILIDNYNKCINDNRKI